MQPELSSEAKNKTTLDISSGTRNLFIHCLLKVSFLIVGVIHNFFCLSVVISPGATQFMSQNMPSSQPSMPPMGGMRNNSMPIPRMSTQPMAPREQFS